jgi:hypothetical protein
MRGQSCIRAVARRQNWLITFAQLRGLGLSRSAIDRMVRAERLFRVHRGVYLVGRPELLRDSGFHAAVLAIGDDAGLMGEVAQAPQHHSTSFRRDFDAYKDGIVRRAGVEVLRLGEKAVTPGRESRTVAQIRRALGAT